MFLSNKEMKGIIIAFILTLSMRRYLFNIFGRSVQCQWFKGDRKNSASFIASFTASSEQRT